jgi:hypothetical protein
LGHRIVSGPETFVAWGMCKNLLRRTQLNHFFLWTWLTPVTQGRRAQICSDPPAVSGSPRFVST